MAPPARRRSCLKQRNDDETSETTKNIQFETEMMIASTARKRVSFSAANHIKEFPKNVSSDTSGLADADMELTKFDTSMFEPDSHNFLDDEDPMDITRSLHNPLSKTVWNNQQASDADMDLTKFDTSMFEPDSHNFLDDEDPMDITRSLHNPLSNAVWNNQQASDTGVSDQPVTNTANLCFPFQYAAPRGKANKLMGMNPSMEYMNPAIGPKLFSKSQGGTERKSKDIQKPSVPSISDFGRFGDPKTPKRLIPADILNRAPLPVSSSKHEAVSLSKHEAVSLSKHEAVSLSKHEAVSSSKHESKHEAVSSSKHESKHEAVSSSKHESKHEAVSSSKHESKHEAVSSSKHESKHEACLDDTAQPDFANLSCDITFGPSSDAPVYVLPPERPVTLALQVSASAPPPLKVHEVTLFETTRASIFQSSFASPSSPPAMFYPASLKDIPSATRSAYIQGLIDTVKTTRGYRKINALDELWRSPHLTEPWDNVKEEIEPYVHPAFFSEDHRW